MPKPPFYCSTAWPSTLWSHSLSSTHQSVGAADVDRSGILKVLPLIHSMCMDRTDSAHFYPPRKLDILTSKYCHSRENKRYHLCCSALPFHQSILFCEYFSPLPSCCDLGWLRHSAVCLLQYPPIPQNSRANHENCCSDKQNYQKVALYSFEHSNSHPSKEVVPARCDSCIRGSCCHKRGFDSRAYFCWYSAPI